MKRTYMLLTLAGCLVMPVQAENSRISPKQMEVMKQLLVDYEKQAKTEEAETKVKLDPKQPFSAEAGKQFYLKKQDWQGLDVTCSLCHTDDPRKIGKHSDTKKPVQPLAPSANPKRFTDAKKVEKNFVEHCHDLFDRDCYGYEKGNYIAFMMSIK